MAKTLKQQTAHAIAWNFVDKFGQQVLNFIVGLILARYFLSPSDYGLMGMIAIFISLSNVLLDSGFGGALVRKIDVTQTDLCSVFYFNMFISICLYLILFFCAPLIASFYSQPLLLPLCRVASLGFLINSTTLIQLIQLTKKTDFKHITIANGVGLVSSATTALLMAFNGFGVWALVWQNIIFYFVRNLLLWGFSAWRPLLIFDIKSIGGMWGFSSKIMITGLLNTMFSNIYPLIIGKLYPAKEVGYYTQANRFSELPSGTIYSMLYTATYPIFSQIGHDNGRLKRAYRKVMRVTSFISFPVLFGVAAIAQPLVYILLTDKWIQIVPYMQKLCIAGGFLPLVGINISILHVKGLSAKALQLEIIRKGLILLCIFLTIHQSISAMVTGLVIAQLIGFVVSTTISGKQIGYHMAEQFKDIFPYFAIASIMACGAYSLSWYINNPLLLLCTQIVLGSLFYFGANYLLGSKIIQEILDIVKMKRG